MHDGKMKIEGGNFAAMQRWLEDIEEPINASFYIAIANRLGGDIATATLLNHIVFWSDRSSRKDGRFYKSTAEITEETGLTAMRIRRGLKVLEDLGIIDKEVARAKGSPTNHFELNMGALYTLIHGKPCSKRTNGLVEKTNGLVKTTIPHSENNKSTCVKQQIMNSIQHSTIHSTKQQYYLRPNHDIDKPKLVPPNTESLMHVSFDRFWSAYPKKVSKGQALITWKKLWKSMNFDQELVGKILEAIRKQKQRGGKLACDIRYIPYPSTWLNALSWEDEGGSGKQIEGEDSDYDAGDLAKLFAWQKES